MYTNTILEEGITYLNITDRCELFFLIDYVFSTRSQISLEENYKNRFKLKQGLDKKELTLILKETQIKIHDLLQEARDYPDNKEFIELNKEEWINKKIKIKKILAMHSEFGTLNITKAKEYPINQLLDFNTAGFVGCLWHGPEKTPSLHFDKKRNKAHCFAGCGDFDSIDIYQKLHNVDFNTALKALS